MRIWNVRITAAVLVLNLALVWFEAGRNLDWHDVGFAFISSIAGTLLIVTLRRLAAQARRSWFFLRFAFSFAFYFCAWTVLGAPLAYIQFRHRLYIFEWRHEIFSVLAFSIIMGLISASHQESSSLATRAGEPGHDITTEPWFANSNATSSTATPSLDSRK